MIGWGNSRMIEKDRGKRRGIVCIDACANRIIHHGKMRRERSAQHTRTCLHLSISVISIKCRQVNRNTRASAFVELASERHNNGPPLWLFGSAMPCIYLQPKAKQHAQRGAQKCNETRRRSAPSDAIRTTQLHRTKRMEMSRIACNRSLCVYKCIKHCFCGVFRPQAGNGMELS